MIHIFARTSDPSRLNAEYHTRQMRLRYACLKRFVTDLYLGRAFFNPSLRVSDCLIPCTSAIQGSKH